MNRGELRLLSSMRAREAKVLLDAGHAAGAYYLAGYAVECALKACIARQVRRGDFPDKAAVNKAWTHNLASLVEAAGLKPQFENDQLTNPALQINWGVVKDWVPESRYDTTVTPAKARDMYRSCTRPHGVLPWVRKRW